MVIKMSFRRVSTVLVIAICLFSYGAVILQTSASAQDNKSTQGFSLQVTPSPLVATLKPGQKTTLELVIRNTNTRSQSLKMGLREFKVDETNGQVNLENNEPPEAKTFVSFSNPTFDVEAGAIFTQKIIVDTPKNAGFTYSFAITIFSQNPTKPGNGSTAIEGSVAVFTLLSVDRPGAVRKFELSEFSVGNHVYEYLPATFSLKLKNSGNTLVQPTGNIYIQRGSNDTQPLSTSPLNTSGGYILPGTSRILTNSWNDGFPRYETLQNENSTTPKQHLAWHLGDLSHFRIGKYTAKVVAVYDDGTRDVPVTAEISFWVIPWRILLGVFAIVVMILVGIITTIRKSTCAVRHKRKMVHDTSDE